MQVSEHIVQEEPNVLQKKLVYFPQSSAGGKKSLTKCSDDYKNTSTSITWCTNCGGSGYAAVTSHTYACEECGVISVEYLCSLHHPQSIPCNRTNNQRTCGATYWTCTVCGWIYKNSSFTHNAPCTHGYDTQHD